eukprot:4624320-Alexandrium_andersonii.AAC.1
MLSRSKCGLPCGGDQSQPARPSLRSRPQCRGWILASITGVCCRPPGSPPVAPPARRRRQSGGGSRGAVAPPVRPLAPKAPVVGRVRGA